MSSVNKVILIGRLGQDPELRYTPNQTAVCTMRMATNDRRRSQDGEWTEHTEWHTVVTFGKVAENSAQYLQKGRMAYIEGRLQTRKYQDQDGKDKYWTEIIANTVQFLGGRSDGMEMERGPAPQAGAGAPVAAASKDSIQSSVGQTVSFDDDDIPF